MRAGMARSNETFKRGQVEWAIWRFFTRSKSAPADPPQVFLTRVKRLLETDRHDKVPAGQHRSPVPYAFSSGEPEGQGVDAAFTSFDAFCLALALDLVDFGFKPSEIVFLLRYLRPVLEGTFQTILRDLLPKASPADSAREGNNLQRIQAGVWFRRQRASACVE